VPPRRQPTKGNDRTTKQAELSEKLVDQVKKTLSEKGLEPERVSFTPMVLPIFKVLPKFITDFVETVEKLGKITEDKRSGLRN
jgi:coenzyme F420-reducing hydrogenase delta subunit